MSISSNLSPEIVQFISQIDPDRQEPFARLIATIQDNIPDGFEQSVGKMVNWMVPLETFPDGYHCTPGEPLPFVNVASNKGAIALYHMGMYAKPGIAEWFTKEYPNHAKYKLDMGKSCIKFKKMNDIPFDLIAELMKKFTVQEWIDIYKNSRA